MSHTDKDGLTKVWNEKTVEKPSSIMSLAVNLVKFFVKPGDCTAD